MSEPQIEIKTDERGNITCRVTEQAVLLTKEEAERLAGRIASLEELVIDLYWQLRSYDWPLGEIDVWKYRMDELGIEVNR